MKNFLLSSMLLCLCANVQAAEVAGVKLADSIHLGSRDLVLNGAGLRTKFFSRGMSRRCIWVRKPMWRRLH